jgi:tetratricopeptide (TPR) repeat protein
VAEEIPAGRDGQPDSAGGQPATGHQVSFGPVTQSGNGTVNQVGVDESTVLVVGSSDEERFSAIAVEPPVGRLPKRVWGRDRILEALWAAVDAPDGRIHVLAGMGGLGKTAIALATAERAQLKGRCVWWVRGERLSLSADLLEVTRQLGARPYELEEARTGRRSAPALVWQYLRQAEPGWVLVVDGADEPEELSAEGRLLRDGGGWIRPGASGLVLVTSRHTADETWGKLTCVHPVCPLEAADGAAILFDLAPKAGPVEEAHDLAYRLGGIPLALHLAGRYLAWPMASHRGFRPYRQALDAQFAATVDAGTLISPGRPDPRDLVMMTWELSLDALDTKGVPQARAMLRRLSFYAPGIPIPRRLLEMGAEIDHMRAAAGSDARTILEQGLNGLLSLGLADVQPLVTSTGQLTELGIVIHPLVAETNRAHHAARPASDSNPLLGGIIQVLELTSKLRTDDPGHWPHWQILAPHISALLSYLASMTAEISTSVLNITAHAAEALLRGGTLAKAEHLASAGLQYARLLDPGHPFVSIFTYQRALIFEEQGRLEEAETEARSVMEMASDGAPSGVLTSRKLLTSVLHKRGHLAEAERECRAVSHAMGLLWGPEDRRTLAACTDLVLILQQQGRLAEAEEEARAVLDAQLRVQGEDHPETLAARHNLALVLTSRGDFRQAERLYRMVLETRWQILGGDHPHTLTTWHLHTQTWWRIDAADEAVAEMERVVRALHDVMGDEHPVFMNAQQDLAAMWFEQGRLIEAAAKMRHLVETSRQIFGDDHPTTLRTRSNLSVITYRGRPNKTLAELQDILYHEQRVLGDNHPSTLMTRQNIAGLLYTQQRFREAEQEFQAVKEAQRRLLGKKHPDFLATQLNHAAALASLGELKAAKIEASIALRVAHQTLGETHPLIQEARNLLSHISLCAGHQDMCVVRS